MKASRLPEHATMVNNILAVYERASAVQVWDGYHWYPTARRMVEAIAEGRSDPITVARVLAALSPRNPWRWNVADAFAFVTAAHERQDERPVATTFNRNADIAWRIANGDTEGWAGAAPKVRNFVECILGNEWSVVVDTWAMRVATGFDLVRNSEYEPVARAYRDAAVVLGLAPCHVQAITWLVLRAEAVGLNGENFKKGTPDVVRAMLEGE